MSFLGGDDPEYVPVLEGLLFVILLLAAHCFLMCFKRDSQDRSGERREVAWVVLWVVLLVSAAISVFVPLFFLAVSCPKLEAGSIEVHLCSAIVTFGFLLATLALLVLPKVIKGFYLLKLKEYSFCVGALLVYAGLNYLILLGLTGLGFISGLELTSQFWYWWVGVGTVTAVLVTWTLSLAALEEKSGLPSNAMKFSFQRQTLGPYSTSPRRTFLVLCALGFLSWNALNTPAAYGNGKLIDFFQEKIDNALPLQVPLVVTGVLLGELEEETQCTGYFPPGEYFLCFDPFHDSGCKAEARSLSASERRLRQYRWKVQEPQPKAVLGAVLASGSPFPIFPPHQVPIRVAVKTRGLESMAEEESTEEMRECKVPLVDGGYTNNVPLAVASVAGTRQVLVIRSSPMETPTSPRWPRFFSLLLRYGYRVFPFLLERAQEVDRRLGEEMMVVSIAPRSENMNGEVRTFPHLVDFRASTIRDLWQWAWEDLEKERLIGRVESWGLPSEPRRLIRDGTLIQPGRPIQLLQRNWSRDVIGILRSKVTGHLGGGGVAVIDLDGGALDGSLLAVLLAEAAVRELQTSQDSPLWDFLEEDPWDMAQEARAAHQKLRLREPGVRERYSLEDLLKTGNVQPSREKFQGLLSETLRRIGDLPKTRQAQLLSEILKARPEWSLRQSIDAALRRFGAEGLDEDGRATLDPRETHFHWGVSLAFHQEIVDLVLGLHKLNWKVWLVGEAPKRAVEEIGVRLGIEPEQSLGFTTERDEAGQPPSIVEILRRKGLKPNLLVSDNVEWTREARSGLVIFLDAEVPEEEIQGGLVRRQSPEVFGHWLGVIQNAEMGGSYSSRVPFAEAGESITQKPMEALE